MLKKDYFKTALQWVERRKFSEIKANCEDFDSPTKFSNPDRDQPFVPDITGVKNGSKYYIEIATKSDDEQRTVSKWKLLSTLASMKGGKLFLLAPRGHKSFAQRIIDRYHLDARLMYIPSMA